MLSCRTGVHRLCDWQLKIILDEDFPRLYSHARYLMHVHFQRMAVSAASVYGRCQFCNFGTQPLCR